MTSKTKLDRCKCCGGEDVFTCEMCGNGLASEPIYFVDTSGIDLDPNYEHTLWVCSDCKDRA
jgi:hypothetical protein